MLKVALLGYGVVGSGVAEMIRNNNSVISKRAGKKISVKKVLVRRQIEDGPDNDIITMNPEEIFEDCEIDVIVEAMGGVDKAYEYTKRALELGKSVVTSNKELVATHGLELTQIASDKKVDFLFEGSVGGGIPIIRPLNNCLAANEILSITGILNGTTNFILWNMENEGLDFKDALTLAQREGYAEADPSADVEGYDTARKLAILSSLAYDKFIDYRDIKTEGITNISLKDIKCANAIGGTIKLIAKSQKLNGEISAWVSPVVVKKDSLLSSIEKVNNGILVDGDAVGETFFLGRGAGKFPTASAVVADIIEVARKEQNQKLFKFSNNVYKDIKDLDEAKYLIRVEVKDYEKSLETIRDIVGQVKFIDVPEKDSNEIVFTVNTIKNDFFNKTKTLLINSEELTKISSIIKILE